MWKRVCNSYTHIYGKYNPAFLHLTNVGFKNIDQKGAENSWVIAIQCLPTLFQILVLGWILPKYVKKGFWWIVILYSTCISIASSFAKVYILYLIW